MYFRCIVSRKISEDVGLLLLKEKKKKKSAGEHCHTSNDTLSQLHRRRSLAASTKDFRDETATKRANRARRSPSVARQSCNSSAKRCVRRGAAALGMALRFKKDQKPTPGFHAIDISNLPDPRAADRARAAEELHAAVRIQAGLRMLRARRTAQDLREAKAQAAAVTCLQSFARGAAARADLARRRQEAREQGAKQQLAAAIIQEHYRQTRPREGGAVGLGGEAGSSSSAEGAETLGDAFVIRNLDTGEVVSLELGAGDASGKDLKLSFGTLQQNPQAWEALKADSKGAPIYLLTGPPRAHARACHASPPPAAAQACWRSSRHRPRSPSARTSCACGRSDTCTPLTTRSATSTSLLTCSRRAARSRSRTHRSSLLVRARAALEPPTPAWAARLGCCPGQRKPQPVR